MHRFTIKIHFGKDILIQSGLESNNDKFCKDFGRIVDELVR